MSKPRYDGVIEAARYRDGLLLWVRAYERHGAAFSDVVILPRESLLERLNSGKRFVTGRRTKYLAGTFQVGKPLRVLTRDGARVIATSAAARRDLLEDTPIF